MRIDINNNIITICSSLCYMCGESQKLTQHHTLPKHLNPINNVIVPICHECHEKINETDIAGLYPYIFKLKKLGEQIKTGSNNILMVLQNQENNIKIKK